MAFKMKGSPHKLGTIQGTSAFKKDKIGTFEELKDGLQNLRAALAKATTPEEKSALQGDINSVIAEMKSLDPNFGGIMP
jgi:hypothetical protein